MKIGTRIYSEESEFIFFYLTYPYPLKGELLRINVLFTVPFSSPLYGI